MQFDVIVGNPPYQSPGSSIGQGQLYPKFIKKCVDILNESGKMAYITPPTFLKDKISCLNGSSLEYINISAGKHFNVGSSIIWYILTKKKIDATLVESETSKFLTKYDFTGAQLIPIGDMSVVSSSIISKIYGIKSSRGFEFERDANEVKKGSVFIRRMNRNKYFNALIVDDDFNIKMNQDYTSFHRASEKFNLLNSNLFSFLYKCYTTSPFITLGFINNIPLPENNIPKDNESIYKIYNLTQEEIEYIEDAV